MSLRTSQAPTPKTRRIRELQDQRVTEQELRFVRAALFDVAIAQQRQSDLKRQESAAKREQRAATRPQGVNDASGTVGWKPVVARPIAQSTGTVLATSAKKQTGGKSPGHIASPARK